MKSSGWLVLWTLLTAPAGFALVVATSGDCSGDAVVCVEYWWEDLIGPAVLVLWLIGSALILGFAGREDPHASHVTRCPSCGQEVSVGTPTCLNCGYNLVARR